MSGSTIRQENHHRLVAMEEDSWKAGLTSSMKSSFRTRRPMPGLKRNGGERCWVRIRQPKGRLSASSILYQLNADWHRSVGRTLKYPPIPFGCDQIKIIISPILGSTAGVAEQPFKILGDDFRTSLELFLVVADKWLLSSILWIFTSSMGVTLVYDRDTLIFSPPSL